MNNTRRNVGLLTACQAMLFTNNSTLIAINGLAGLALAPTPSLALQSNNACHLVGRWV